MTRLRPLPDPDHLPALDTRFALRRPGIGLGLSDHPPRILLLYGSLRERSYSRLATEEAARLLRFYGAEVRIFDPSDLPFPDQIAGDDHPAIHELREHAIWSEGMVWCSPEQHGQITGLMKAQSRRYLAGLAKGNAGVNKGRAERQPRREFSVCVSRVVDRTRTGSVQKILVRIAAVEGQHV
jgi:arsenical resistance protein ArsH